MLRTTGLAAGRAVDRAADRRPEAGPTAAARVGGRREASGRRSGGRDGRTDGERAAPTPRRRGGRCRALLAPLLGLGLATAARCGPELTSPDGVEAQTCVLTAGRARPGRARTTATPPGGNSTSVLSLMGPGGRTVQMHCAVGARRRAGGVRDAPGAHAGRAGGVHGGGGVRGTGRRGAAAAALREQLRPLVRALTPCGIGTADALRTRAWKDPVAGDGGCTSDRASRTVTRDRPFANSISAIRTRIYLSRRASCDRSHRISTHSIS